MFAGSWYKMFHELDLEMELKLKKQQQKTAIDPDPLHNWPITRAIWDEWVCVDPYYKGFISS